MTGEQPNIVFLMTDHTNAQAIAADPHECHNLIDDTGREDILRDMVKRMWRKMKAIGDTSLFNTQYATLRTTPVGSGILEE